MVFILETERSHIRQFQDSDLEAWNRFSPGRVFCGKPDVQSAVGQRVSTTPCSSVSGKLCEKQTVSRDESARQGF